MASPFLYLDSSALVKLVLPEAESAALAEFLEDWEDPVSSTLAAIEVSYDVRLAEAAERREIEILVPR